MGVFGLQTFVGRHRDSKPGPPACESGVRSHSHYATGAAPINRCNWFKFSASGAAKPIHISDSSLLLLFLLLLLLLLLIVLMVVRPPYEKNASLWRKSAFLFF